MIRYIILLNIVVKCFTKRFVLLPYNSDLCINSTSGINTFYEFTISQQLNFETTSDETTVLNDLKMIANDTYSWKNNEENSVLYLCRALVKPMGRPLEDHTEFGLWQYWNIRARIDRIKSEPKCNDKILLQFRHKDNLVTKLEGHSSEVFNKTCQDNLPQIIPSEFRKLYITYFSSSTDNSGFVINITSFILFKGTFTITFQRNFCNRSDGFWCGDESAACIYRDMKCDKFDSCFDGGSDEIDCRSYLNSTTRNSILKPGTGFIDYLPWLALGILPLILLMALVCICNQHRSEVYFEDDDENLDLEKSHEELGEKLWSSVDGIDRFGKLNELSGDDDDIEKCVNEGVYKDTVIALQTIHNQPVTKVEISSSVTNNSLNKTDYQYEDIDRSVNFSGEPNRVNVDANVTKIIKNELDGKSHQALLPPMNKSNNVMSLSQITDDDYEDHLEDVGSLLRKVDKSKIPEEIRNSITKISPSNSSDLINRNSTKSPTQAEAETEYRSDYILV